MTSLADTLRTVLVELISERAHRTDVTRHRVSDDGAAFLNGLVARTFGDAVSSVGPDWLSADLGDALPDAGDRLVLTVAWGHRRAVIDIDVGGDPAPGVTQVDAAASAVPDPTLAGVLAAHRHARAVDLIIVRAGATDEPRHVGPGQRQRRVGWGALVDLLRTSFPNEARAVILADFLTAHVAAQERSSSTRASSGEAQSVAGAPVNATCERSALVDAVVELARRCAASAPATTGLDVRFASEAHAAEVADAANARLGAPVLWLWRATAGGPAAASTPAGRETGRELRVRPARERSDPHVSQPR